MSEGNLLDDHLFKDTYKLDQPIWNGWLKTAAFLIFMSLPLMIAMMTYVIGQNEGASEGEEDYNTIDTIAIFLWLFFSIIFFFILIAQARRINKLENEKQVMQLKKGGIKNIFNHFIFVLGIVDALYVIILSMVEGTFILEDKIETAYNFYMIVFLFSLSYYYYRLNKYFKVFSRMSLKTI